MDHLDWATGGSDDVPALVASGPLLGPDGAPDGSLLIFAASGADVVRAFVERDPLALAGVWASCAVRELDWRRGRPDG